MRNPIDDLIEQSEMTREEFSKLPIDPWQYYVTAAMFTILATLIGGPAVFSIMAYQVNGTPIYIALIVAAMLLILATITLWARKYTRVVALLSVLAATIAGIITFLGAQGILYKGLIALVAAGTIANALEKLFKSSHNRALIDEIQKPR